MLTLRLLFVLIVLIAGGLEAAEPLPATQAGAIEYLMARGLQFKLDESGNAVRLMSTGKPELTVDEYQLIRLLTELEQMGLNAAPLKEDEWGFLKELPKLKTLSIWHGHHFATLKPFCGLPVESLTIGGCMGLRDLNKENPEQLRHAITTLSDLPNVKKINLYHSPLGPDDSHVKHLATQFPALEDIRLDLSSPRGSETTISSEGLRSLQTLPLTKLNFENATTFTSEHFAAIAEIKSLKKLIIDSKSHLAPTDGIAAFRQLRPDVEVVVELHEVQTPSLPAKKPAETVK